MLPNRFQSLRWDLVIGQWSSLGRLVGLLANVWPFYLPRIWGVCGNDHQSGMPYHVAKHWSYSTVHRYSKPYLGTLGSDPCDHSLCIDFIPLGSVTTNPKNKLTGEQLAIGTDIWFVSTVPSWMCSIAMEGCHVGYSHTFIGMVYCTDGQSNTTYMVSSILLLGYSHITVKWFNFEKQNKKMRSYFLYETMVIILVWEWYD